MSKLATIKTTNEIWGTNFPVIDSGSEATSDELFALEAALTAAVEIDRAARLIFQDRKVTFSDTVFLMPIIQPVLQAVRLSKDAGKAIKTGTVQQKKQVWENVKRKFYITNEQAQRDIEEAAIGVLIIAGVLSRRIK